MPKHRVQIASSKAGAYDGIMRACINWYFDKVDIEKKIEKIMEEIPVSVLAGGNLGENITKYAGLKAEFETLTKNSEVSYFMNLVFGSHPSAACYTSSFDYWFHSVIATIAKETASYGRLEKEIQKEKRLLKKVKSLVDS